MLIDKRRFCSLICLFLIILMTGELSARQKDEGKELIKQAKQDIEDKNYNEAISKLTEAIRINPHLMDEAEFLLRKIREIRREYNDQYEDLFNVLYPPDGSEVDIEKARRMIQEIEKLDLNPNEATKKALLIAKRNVELAYGRKKFKEIMAKARIAIDNQQYAEALKLYQSGFDLHRNEFENASYGNIIKQQVFTALADLNQLIDSFSDLEAELGNSLNTVRARLDQGDSLQSLQALQQLSRFYQNISDFRRRSYQDYRIFTEQKVLAEQSNDNQEPDQFLGYMRLLTAGRAEAEKREGILGALNTLWEDNINFFLTRLQAQFKAALDNNQYSRALNYALAYFFTAKEKYRNSDYFNANSRLIQNTYLSTERLGRNFTGFISRLQNNTESYLAALNSENNRQERLTALKRDFNALKLIEDEFRLRKEEYPEQANPQQLHFNREEREKQEFISPFNNHFLDLISSLRKDQFKKSNEVLVKRAQGAFKQAMELLNQDNYQAASDQFKKTGEEIQDLLSFQEIWENNLESGLILQSNYAQILSGQFSLNKNEEEIIGDIFPRYFYFRQLSRLAEDYQSACALLSREMKLEEDSDALQLRREIEERSAFFNSLREKWQQEKGRFQTLQNNPWDLSRIFPPIDTFTANNLDFMQEDIDLEIEIVRRLLDQGYSALNNQFKEARELYEEGKALQNGVENSYIDEGVEQSIVSKYPARANQKYEESTAILRQLLDRGRELVNNFETDKIMIRQQSILQEKANQIRALLDQMSPLLSEMQNLRQEANQSILLAGRYKNEGELRLREAESALNSENFDLARDKVQAAQESFVNSLSYQEDEELRSSLNQRISSLSTRILQAENEKVIRITRQLIEEGKDAYLQGEFDLAEEKLTQAQTTWRRTNNSDNEEVLYWLNFVRAALSVGSEREIEVIDPLYNEMMRFYNLALDDFIKARKMLEADKEKNRTEAFALLDKAEKTLKSIVLPFPRNQKARVLQLRIEQYRNPRQFDRIFRERYQEAIALVNNNPGEGYAVLLDLAAIRADYPGLQKAIYNAEIALGIRIPPPSPQDIQRSRQLYNQAYRIVAQNLRAQFSIAEKQLNEAIRLNPNNSQAKRLIDRIRSGSTGGAVITLSIEDQQQYKKALNNYVQGNYYVAWSIVNQLLQKPRNRNYSPLVELAQRIKAKL